MSCLSNTIKNKNAREIIISPDHELSVVIRIKIPIHRLTRKKVIFVQFFKERYCFIGEKIKLLFRNSYLLDTCSIFFCELLCLISCVMFVFFRIYDSRKSRCYNRSHTIKARLISAIHRSSFYRNSLSSGPNNRVHFCMNFVFIGPIMMLWSIGSLKMISTIDISRWSTIVSSRNNASIFDNHGSGFSGNAF